MAKDLIYDQRRYADGKKHTKWCSTSFVIGELQIKTTRAITMHIKMAKI